jgi:hypothetical protein
MDLKRPLVVLALLGSLTGGPALLAGCGETTDVVRDEQDCNTAEDNADCEDAEDGNSQDESEDDD